MSEAEADVKKQKVDGEGEAPVKKPVGKRGPGKPKNQAMDSAFLAAKALETGRNRLNILASQVHSKCSLYGNVEITLVVSTTLQRCRSQGGGSRKRKLLGPGETDIVDDKQLGGQNHAAGSNIEPSLAAPLYLWVYGNSNAAAMTQQLEEAKGYITGATPAGLEVTDFVGRKDKEIADHIKEQQASRTRKTEDGMGAAVTALPVGTVCPNPVKAKGPLKQQLKQQAKAKAAAVAVAAVAVAAIASIVPTPPLPLPAVPEVVKPNPDPTKLTPGKRGPGKPKNVPLQSPNLVAKALDTGRNRMFTQAAQLYAKCALFGNVDITLIVSTTLQRCRSQGGGSRKTDDLQRTGAGHDLTKFMHIYHNSNYEGMLKHMNRAQAHAQGTEIDGLVVTDYVGFTDTAISASIESNVASRRRETNQNWKPPVAKVAAIPASEMLLAVTAAPGAASVGDATSATGSPAAAGAGHGKFKYRAGRSKSAQLADDC